ncbi:MAG: shikimate kinase [Rhodobacteraceae bacterium]|nr:shikimate kinase [Paracoccaceae bacterium]
MNDQSEQTSVPALDRTIVVVGLMGAGKSSIGRRLATALGVPFVDADAEIERAAGLTVAEIFEKYGEEYFRDGERRVIRRLLDGTPKILATGGGAFTFCNTETRQLILDKAISVWLDSDIDTLVERTSRKDNRPLLKQGDPREILAKLREERRPAYSQAQIHVLSGNGPHSRVVNKILKGIALCL